MIDDLNPDRSLWHLIAVEVRRQRELHHMSGNQLADRLEVDRSTVSRWENGLRRLGDTYAKKLDALWHTNGLFERLVGFATAIDVGDWMTDLSDYQARATRHRMWETVLVPGLFQTPDYARAALRVGLTNDSERALEQRLTRQAAVLDQPKIPHMSVILNWVVLAQPVGNAEVMRGQLVRLLEIADLPNVSVRVLEREAKEHCGLDGPFHLLTVDDKDIAFDDASMRGRLMLDPAEVQYFAVKYDRISDLATPVGPSRALIEQAMETYQ
ncbi:helix-turn-helix domain-containing protein [Actinomadura sp. 9N215]|uniref:helix-turn-helix domain-containing protein n=1 Tax=Actinomadura sp. 9N215 TaxID=3375150 RepID=UPI0037B22DFC